VVILPITHYPSLITAFSACYDAQKYIPECAMATIELTKDNFEDVVTKNKIVLIDFWAPWCGRAPGLVSRRPVCGHGAPVSARDLVE
jgi:thioredoxin-like negative regulator of GroEL